MPEKVRIDMKWFKFHRNSGLTPPTGSKFDFRVIPHVDSGQNLQNNCFMNVFFSICRFSIFFGALYIMVGAVVGGMAEGVVIKFDMAMWKISGLPEGLYRYDPDVC